jgi:hypothetical protein
MSANLREPSVTFSRISMRSPDVALSHFMNQCMDILHTLSNLGEPKVTLPKISIRR